MNKKERYIFILILFVLGLFPIHGQNHKQIKEVLLRIRLHQLDSAQTVLNSLDSLHPKINSILNQQILFSKNGTLKKIKINVYDNPMAIGLKKMHNGDYYLFKEYGQDSLAYRLYAEAHRIFKKNNFKSLSCESISKILYYNHKFSRDTIQLKKNIQEYQGLVSDSTEFLFYHFNKIITDFVLNSKRKKKTKSPMSDFSSGIRLSKKINNNYFVANFTFLKALNQIVSDGNLNNAIELYNKSLEIYKSEDSFIYQNKRFDCYLSLGGVQNLKGNYKLALENLYKALENKSSFIKKRDLYSLHFWLSTSHQKLNQYKEAYKHAVISSRIKDSINQHNQNIAKADLESKYQNEKLKNENLESNTKRIQNRNIAIALAAGLATTSIIAFLVYNNIKRKKRLSDKETELKSRELASVLKEQELASIDAMIEGQEKERQRIAEDLHDDLGGLMASLKLHFESLQQNPTQEKFSKTQQFIDDAYNKIRTIAHAKNTGVIAKQGLLIAVQQMAQKISASNQLQIEVIDYGLDNPIENSLELSLFRTIQELVTNTIKHAMASEVVIHLTLDNDSINLMVEDNGIGFDPEIKSPDKGMGLSNIQKRVAHLNGNLQIDSVHFRGTTIIIDIPLFSSTLN